MSKTISNLYLGENRGAKVTKTSWKQFFKVPGNDFRDAYTQAAFIGIESEVYDTHHIMIRGYGFYIQSLAVNNPGGM